MVPQRNPSSLCLLARFTGPLGRVNRPSASADSVMATGLTPKPMLGGEPRLARYETVTPWRKPVMAATVGSAASTVGMCPAPSTMTVDVSAMPSAKSSA
jgi:hypothetical protein